MSKISDVSCEETLEPLTYNLPLMTEDTNYTVLGWKIDFSKIYGKLESGEYIFSLFSEDYDTIKISFAVDQNGNVTYEEAKIL